MKAASMESKEEVENLTVQLQERDETELRRERDDVCERDWVGSGGVAQGRVPWESQPWSSCVHGRKTDQ